MTYQKECILEDKECTNCGECDICDLNPNKICDNCCQCIEADTDFKGIYIDDIIENDIKEDDIENILFEEEVVDEL